MVTMPVLFSHALIYSRAPEETRAILQKILKTWTVDAGGGWSIMALPPGEIARAPNRWSSLARALADVRQSRKTLAELEKAGIHATGAISQETWGRRTAIAVGRGEKLGQYEPRHLSPIAATRRSSARPKVAKAHKAPAKKVVAKRGKRNSSP
jgi:hypothetical protein